MPSTKPKRTSNKNKIDNEVKRLTRKPLYPNMSEEKVPQWLL
ncbi:unnamed protein product [Larinioides sclopetarius]|uniref:Uncharacterized protein n=1 Tax=Larinioides sclopetarius TaxID=280406 RepID=A0AAV1Z5F9_9ARAC